MAQKTVFHLEACPSNNTGLLEDCSCAEEAKRYTKLAKISVSLFSFEYVGSMVTKSKAFESDAWHVAVDGVENVVNIIVSRLARNSDNEASLRKWGGKISALLLLYASYHVIYEGYERVIIPQQVKWYMAILAIIGLGVNLYQQYIHWKAPKEHRNEQHFWQNLHLWGDISSSIAVVIGGLIMWATNDFYWIDGALSIMIGCLLVVLTSARLFGLELHSHNNETNHSGHAHGPGCNHKH